MRKTKSQEKKVKRDKLIIKKHNKGITLIALVITIIVLLILAGVTINTLTGDNGILTRAREAKSATGIAEENEKRELAMAEAAMNMENTTYEGITIPAGFAPTRIDGENKVEDGLVITDSEGNEFVWIPVAKETFETNFKRIEGYKNGILQNELVNTDEANELGENKKFTEENSIQEEAKKMYASVKENGGFYFGRFEAGKDDNENVIVKKNAVVYNKITWGQNVKDCSGGAVEKARNMYKFSSSVISTLCYGVQWDAALNFIDPNYITNSCNPNSYVANANGKGWDPNNYKSGNPNHLTGIDIDVQKSNCQKNIYDMAGNVSELTMEFINNNENSKKPYRVRRGSGFDWDCNASIRSLLGTYPNEEQEFIGFRVALFVK